MNTENMMVFGYSFVDVIIPTSHRSIVLGWGSKLYLLSISLSW
jgi:hypothetical protein